MIESARDANKKAGVYSEPTSDPAVLIGGTLRSQVEAGSHEGTDFLPEKVKSDEAKDMFFCGCKMSKNGALCDGTHKEL